MVYHLSKETKFCCLYNLPVLSSEPQSIRYLTLLLSRWSNAKSNRSLSDLTQILQKIHFIIKPVDLTLPHYAYGLNDLIDLRSAACSFFNITFGNPNFKQPQCVSYSTGI